jgi:large subunit ribosomal protein L28e
MSDDLHHVVLIWPHTDAKEVLIQGEWDDWATHVPMKKTATGFEAEVQVPWGKATEYKFLVDGEWKLSDLLESKTDYDPSGKYLNNTYTAPPKPKKKGGAGTKGNAARAAVRDAPIKPGSAATPASRPITNNTHDLQWLLLRKNNSFMVKRVVEGPVFSKEPGNLINIHSHKYSGLTNAKTIHIFDSGNGLAIHSRSADASPYHVKSTKKKHSIGNRAGGRKALGSTAKVTTKDGYRPDLRTAALGRASRLLEAQRTPKETPKKNLRGKKAKTAATEAAAAE